MHLTFAILMSQASNYTQGLNSNGRGNGFFSCHLEHRHSKQILLRWLSKHLHSITAHMGLWDSDTSALFPGRAGTFDAVEINSLWFIYNKKGRKIHMFLFQQVNSALKQQRPDLAAIPLNSKELPKQTPAKWKETLTGEYKRPLPEARMPPALSLCCSHLESPTPDFRRLKVPAHGAAGRTAPTPAPA